MKSCIARIVYPSAAAFRVSRAPTVPDAPLILATTMVLPSAFCMLLAMTRQMASVSPPAGQGTIIRIGLSG